MLNIADRPSEQQIPTQWPTSLSRSIGIGLATIGMLTSTGVTADAHAQIIGFNTPTGWHAYAMAGDAAWKAGRLFRTYPVVSDLVHPAVEQASSAMLIRRLRHESGLTWDQLARLFGVSRRAVHLWSTGGRLRAGNQELLSELIGLITTLPGSTPEEKRAALLAPRDDGGSIFDELRSRHASTEGDINRAPSVAARADQGEGTVLG
jgi:transcriptional regulator with XRE-family HTH domain